MLLGPAAEAAGLALDVRNVAQGAEVPAGPDGFVGVVVLGGSAGVADAPDAPHLYDEMDLIRATAQTGTPLLGICLGAQLAAEALGGSVRRGEDGVEVGWVEVRSTGEDGDDPVAAAAGEGVPLFQWHRDVFEPPPGATLLAHGGPLPEPGLPARRGVGRAGPSRGRRLGHPGLVTGAGQRGGPRQRGRHHP